MKNKKKNRKENKTDVTVSVGACTSEVVQYSSSTLLLSSNRFGFDGKVGKVFVYLFFLVFSACFVSAGNLSVDGLIASYDFDFNAGRLNVTGVANFMSDLDGDGVNDTLFVNLTSNESSGSYYAYVDVHEAGGKISKGINKTLSSGNGNFLINFSSALLSLHQFNYTIRVEDSSRLLIYQDDRYVGSSFASYEAGTSIISIIDENVNNDYVRINLTLNVTSNETANLTVVLSYKNSSISSTEQKILTVGTQVVSVAFDNETIKATHHSGNFTIDSVTIGDKVIDKNQSTYSYNYETFAKTSYLKNYSYALIDTNANNFSEFLELNFTVYVKSNANYSLQAELYDEFNNFVAFVNESSELSTGEKIITSRLNGSAIYKTKLDGPYVISFAGLSKNGNITDAVYYAYTTGFIYYHDFERPPLPDLKLTMNISFSGNQSNVTINVTNAGEAPAFNINVEIFNNLSYQNQSSAESLLINESKLFSFLVSNTYNDTRFFAIVDFSNFVDEGNESNNVVSNAPAAFSVSVDSLSSIYSNGTSKVFEVVIRNSGTSGLNNVSWFLSFGDGVTWNSTVNSSLSSGKKLYLFVRHVYTSQGTFNITFNATDSNSGASAVSSIVSTNEDISVSNLGELSYNLSRRTIEFLITNNRDVNSSVNWTVLFGDGTNVSSVNASLLRPDEAARVYLEHNYPTQGDYVINVTAQSNSSISSSRLNVKVEFINAANFSSLNVSDSLVVFKSHINNLMSVPMNNVSWSLDTGQSKINSTNNISLSSLESLVVLVKYNYSSSGSFAANFTATNGSWISSRTINVTIT